MRKLEDEVKIVWRSYEDFVCIKKFGAFFSQAARAGVVL
jgi:hypothetical protein